MGYARVIGVDALGHQVQVLHEMLVPVGFGDGAVVVGARPPVSQMVVPYDRDAEAVEMECQRFVSGYVLYHAVGDLQCGYRGFGGPFHAVEVSSDDR